MYNEFITNKELEKRLTHLKSFMLGCVWGINNRVKLKGFTSSSFAKEGFLYFDRHYISNGVRLNNKQKNKIKTVIDNLVLQIENESTSLDKKK